MYLWPAINSDCIKKWIQKHQNWNATHSFSNSFFGQYTSAWALDGERRGKNSAQTDFDTLLDALFLSLMHLPCLYLFLTSELVPLDFSSLKLHLLHNCSPFGVWFIRRCPSREDLLIFFSQIRAICFPHRVTVYISTYTGWWHSSMTGIGLERREDVSIFRELKFQIKSEPKKNCLEHFNPLVSNYLIIELSP